MPDILPEQTPVWQHIERTVADLLAAYAYREIRFPIVESTELFKRSIGEVTDIVEKEMYTFDDRNGDSLTLRPEGTAGCVRAAIQNGLINQPQRLWYTGPMFRYERPQKGRQRQFHQIGVECFGLDGPDIDAEQICMLARLWKTLGVADHVRLELNSLGSPEARSAYRALLVEYLEQHRGELDEDSERRLESNPLRILDSKNERTQQILAGAPMLHEHLDAESAAHFKRVCELLDAAGVAYVINPKLVRGLDYYCKTVFEWVTESLGAQGTVCGGGRYDGLVEQLGGQTTRGLGFAMGIERLVLLLEAAGVSVTDRASPDVYWVLGDEDSQRWALALSERMRDAAPNLKMQLHSGGGSFKSQMKKADKSGAVVALLVGEDERNAGEVTLRYLRDSDRSQERVSADALESKLATELAHCAD